MRTVILNADEQAILARQDPDSGGDGGWQGLLVALQALVQPDGSVNLTDALMERIQRYAFNYGNGGWETRLLGIFGRTLGPRLDGNL